MPTLTVKHEGGLASSINVRGHKVTTDVPEHLGGDDRGPTPPDLLAGALGGCIALYIARWAAQAGVAHEGLEVEVEYEVDSDAHCMPVIGVKVKMPAEFPEVRRQSLMRVAEHCTIHNTLCRLPQISIELAEPAAV
ncbi:MAG: OsmC family protein [Armatimonadetes bacterium]|nr:OsmC family protein [Armatimonadota bacterium]